MIPAPSGPASLTDVRLRSLVAVGSVLATGGGVAAGIAFLGIGSAGNCGNPGMPVCPPGIGNDFYLAAGGIVTGAIGSVLSLGLGLLFFAAAIGVTGAVRGSVVMAASGLSPVVLVLVLAAIPARGGRRKAMGRLAAQRAEEAETAAFKASALRAAGIVLALADTGESVGDDPVARVMIGYTRADGTVARVETTERLPRLSIPRPGDPATVWYDPEGDRVIAQVHVLGGSGFATG
jgi:hypothetical protein